MLIFELFGQFKHTSTPTVAAVPTLAAVRLPPPPPSPSIPHAPVAAARLRKKAMCGTKEASHV